MVVSLGPGKFYGTSLPRPYIYTDVKNNTHRVDPPASVVEPFLTWANDAHWSMGGLNFNRLRLQGRIEGNIQKLRAEQEKRIKMKIHDDKDDGVVDVDVARRSVLVDPPTPPAPVKNKRRRSLRLNDDDDVEVPATVTEKVNNRVRVSEGNKGSNAVEKNGVGESSGINTRSIGDRVSAAKKRLNLNIDLNKDVGIEPKSSSGRVSAANKVGNVEIPNEVRVSGNKRIFDMEESNRVDGVSGINARLKRKLARNLGDDFDKVAIESGMFVPEEENSLNGDVVKEFEKSSEKLKKGRGRKLVKASAVRSTLRLRNSPGGSAGSLEF